MVKDIKLSETYAKPIPKPIKPKKFNIQEEEIKHGWSLAKGTQFLVRHFGFLEKMWVFFSVCAIISLGLLKGFLNIDISPLLNGSIPFYFSLAIFFVLGETLFHFIFLGGRITKLDWVKETIPYKLISYILGGIAVIFTPIATIIGGAMIPLWLNHVYGNFVAKRNFDRRAEYYVPEAFQKETYEEPEHKKQEHKEQVDIHKRVNFKQPPQSPFSGPKVEAMSDSNIASFYTDSVPVIDLPTLSSLNNFLGRMGF